MTRSAAARRLAADSVSRPAFPAPGTGSPLVSHFRPRGIHSLPDRRLADRYSTDSARRGQAHVIAATIALITQTGGAIC